VTAAVVGIAVAIAGITGWFAFSGEGERTPADDPSEDLGIFAPVAGRILYVKDPGIDVGYDQGIWGVDPFGPSDTTDGPSVADDVASTLVRLGTEDAEPIEWSSDGIALLGWSGDGTELLFMRSGGDPLLPQQHLYILHADGSETQVSAGPVGGAAISPDGSRVAYSADGLYVVDVEGGQPVRVAEDGSWPTFSPDGTQIAYLVYGDDVAGNVDEEHVWVVNADGTDAHEILAGEGTVFVGVSGLRWSPAGDRLALGVGGAEGTDALAIYTFAPDGSDFTRVITGGGSPFWSPDGSQIAYTILCEERPTDSCPGGSILRSQYEAQPSLFGGGSAGLAIAEADGSEVREFGFAASGPWHPGASFRVDEPTPTPGDNSARANGEVLSFGGVVTFAGTPWDSAGDLGAVNPETGEERVLVADLDKVVAAEWSADGRWVAYERLDEGDIELWVVGASQEPRLIATGGYFFADGSVGWAWSATGADLLWARRTGAPNTIDRSKLNLVDVETGETVVLGSVDGDVGLDPAWSPDGTRTALATGDGSVYSVDVGSGERSLLARLPDMDLDPSPSIEWSPDGTHIAVVNDMGDAGERLYVMDADGSNVRLLADSNDLLLVSWSPDGMRLAFAEGSQAEFEARILVAPMDGSDPAEIARVPIIGCRYNYMCGLTWSPDGSAIGFHKDQGEDLAIAADGSGEPEPIDDLTYMSWAGGRYGEG
jgi:Tol biopolymer transport system component